MTPATSPGSPSLDSWGAGPEGLGALWGRQHVQQLHAEDHGEPARHVGPRDRRKEHSDRAGNRWETTACVGFLIHSKAHTRSRERGYTHLCSLDAASPNREKIERTPPILLLTKGRTPRSEISSGPRAVHTGSLGRPAWPPAWDQPGLALTSPSIPLRVHCCHLGGLR